MRFGPRRGHFMYIFERFFVDFGLMLAALIYFLFTGNWETLVDNAAILVAVFIGPIARILNYLFTIYSIDDEFLYVNKGLINKKNAKIPIKTITTVDFKQNILFQLANVFIVDIDTGANISGSDDMKMRLALKKDDGLYFKELLIGKKNVANSKTLDGSVEVNSAKGEITKENLNYNNYDRQLKASPKDLLFSGLMASKSGTITQSLGLIISAFFLILEYFPSIKVQEDNFNEILEIGGIILIPIIVVLLFVSGIIIDITKSFIKYYGFTIKTSSEAVFIQYGLFTKNSHTLYKKKISGVKFKQPLLMRIFGFGALEVFAVGYGDEKEKNTVSVLFPIMKKSNLYTFLNDLLPELKLDEDFVKPPKRAFKYFFLQFNFFFSIGLFIISMIISLQKTFSYMEITNSPLASTLLAYSWILGAGILILSFSAVVLRYKHTAIFSNKACVCFSGGGFTKYMDFYKTSLVEAAQSKATLLKRKRGLINIAIKVWGSKNSSMAMVKNIETPQFEKLEKNLTY